MRRLVHRISRPLVTRVWRRVERVLARRGLRLAPLVPDAAPGYVENPPLPPRKLSEYLSQADGSGEIESPEIVALHQAVARYIGPARSIVNVGSVSAVLERFVAVDRSLEIVANVRDESFAEWARAAAPHPNVSYRPGGVSALLDEYGRFDLALAVEVIDGQEDFAGFLRGLSRLADRVIVTAANKARCPASLGASPPIDRHRVREWTAGEFYWVLKSHFATVELFSLPDPVVPHAVAIGLLNQSSPLIAVCGRS